MRTTYSSVYNTSAKGTPAPIAGSQAATYSRPQTTQTTTYNSRGATAPPISTASAASQAGKVVVKVSGTTTSRITTPAVTAASNHVTTTSGKTTTSKQVGTPAVVATNNVKTTNTGTTATRITTPAVVLSGNVKNTTLNTTATRITTPAVVPMGSVITTTKKAMVPMVGTPPVVTAIASNGSGNAPDKRVDVLRVHWGNRTQNYEVPTIQKSNLTEELHKKLDRAGYVPFVGDGADFANGVVYAKEGDWLNAGISTAAIFIDGATAGRAAKNAAQEATERVARNVTEELGEETVEKAGRETAENVAERTGREVVEGGTVPKGTLTGKLDGLTADERGMVEDLLSSGKNVEIIPRSDTGKTPDFFVDGVKTELKTLNGSSLNTPVTRIEDGFEQGAEVVIIDGRKTGLTLEQAETVIVRALGKYDGELPGIVEIWTKEGIVRR